MQATNYYERLALNPLLGVDAPGVPQLYLALYLSDPTETGAAGTEVAYTAYARQPFSLNAPYLNNGYITVANTDVITFPAPDVDIGEVPFVAITDSPTRNTGNMYLYDRAVTPLTLRNGQETTMRAGDVVHYASGNASEWYATAIFNILRNVTLAAMTPCAALYSGMPSAGGAELTGSGYARPAVTFTSPTEAASGHSQIQNASLVAFPSPTTAWGSWGATALMSAATGGNLITAYQNAIPEAITENINVQLRAGDIAVSIH